MPRSTRKSRRTGKKSARARREPPRVVLDTNVWVSALLWTGPPNDILRIGEAKRIVLVASPSIVEEAREVLARPKFAPRLAALETSVGELVVAPSEAVLKLPRSRRQPVAS